MCVINKGCYWSSSFSLFLGPRSMQMQNLWIPGAAPWKRTQHVGQNNIINMSDGVGSV